MRGGSCRLSDSAGKNVASKWSSDVFEEEIKFGGAEWGSLVEVRCLVFVDLKERSGSGR